VVLVPAHPSKQNYPDINPWHQNKVESSTFISEFVALKITVKMNIALHYKIWMMGIPIEEPKMSQSLN
jgi:hypothetical protein